MEPDEVKIIFKGIPLINGIPLVSKLTKLSGTGAALNMDNKIELFKVDESGNRELLLTTYEIWNKEGYSLKVVKSKSCQLENSYVERMTRTLLPMVTVLEGSKLEIVEEDS